MTNILLKSNTKLHANGLVGMEGVINNALPGIGEACIKQLCHKLDDIGVISIKDLEFVEESDISNILKPIQLRKFLKFCHETIPSSSIEMLEPFSSEATQNRSASNSSIHSPDSSSFLTQHGNSTTTSSITFGSSFQLQQNNSLPNSPIHTPDSSPFPVKLTHFAPNSLMQTLNSTSFQLQHNHSSPITSIQSQNSSSLQTQHNHSTNSSFTDENIQISNSFSLIEKDSNNELWADDFLIDYNSIPREIIEAAHKNEPLPKKHINQMVRNLVIQIMNLHPNPGRKEVRTIANIVVAKFPNIFEDKIVDDELVSGVQMLMKKLENCIDNRKRNTMFLEKNFGHEKRKRKTIRDSYGCVNWQPAEFPMGENNETQKHHQLWLQTEHTKMERDEFKIEQLMNKTYTSQRYFINQSKQSILSIKEEWPFLLEQRYLLQHAENLLCKNLTEFFDSALPIIGKQIYNFMKTKMNNSKVERCFDVIRKEKQIAENSTPEIIGAIPLLMAYFNEDERLLIRENMDLDECVSSTEISTPHITTFRTNIYQANEFTVVIDGHGTTYTKCFLSALTCVFAAYYVFNIQYNPGVAHTMEFIQRCYADINPGKGTKVARTAGSKQYNISSKVLKLINDLKSFEGF